MAGCTVSTEYTRRGIDVVRLENVHLQIEILAGKGGDVTELRDKRTDTDLMFEVPYEWHAPGDGYVGSPDSTFAYMDHYPGGWQNIAPNAGGPATVQGAEFGLHTGSALSPWDVTVEKEGPERVAVRLSLSMTRYPLAMERRLILHADEAALRVEDEMTNKGETTVPYSWLQHVAFGSAFLGPGCTVDVPCETVLVDPQQDAQNARFEPKTEHDWPVAETADGNLVDLRSPPSKDERVHDLLALTSLQADHYTVRNPDLDLSAQVSFPSDLYEYVWYWGAFGGFEKAPFFGRNYNLGLEPCTSIPNAGLDSALESETANYLDPGETVMADLAVETGTADD